MDKALFFGDPNFDLLVVVMPWIIGERVSERKTIMRSVRKYLLENCSLSASLAAENSKFFMVQDLQISGMIFK
jgi:hypothetical protein